MHLTTQRGLPRNADRLRLTRTEPTKGHSVWVPARQPVELTIHALEDRLPSATACLLDRLPVGIDPSIEGYYRL